MTKRSRLETVAKQLFDYCVTFVLCGMNTVRCVDAFDPFAASAVLKKSPTDHFKKVKACRWIG